LSLTLSQFYTRLDWYKSQIVSEHKDSAKTGMARRWLSGSVSAGGLTMIACGGAVDGRG